MPTSLDYLKEYTTVVSDTGLFGDIAKYTPTDATTNPSLILEAVNNSENGKNLLKKALEFAKSKSKDKEHIISLAFNKLLVYFGKEILKIIPGRVSTEVDASISFNKDEIIESAKELISLYADEGIPKERILIKIASTWEGIQAAKVLEEKHGIGCNLTLLFSLPQAAACAEAGVTLISPFVGRILDFYKEKTGKDYSPEEDPGVVFVTNTYYYYKKYGYKTQIMGASFRNVGEIEQLAGSDLLTISPKLLEQLMSSTKKLERKLDPQKAKAMPISKIASDEASFRYQFNADEMATCKLAEGIRKFDADGKKLRDLIEKNFNI